MSRINKLLGIIVLMVGLLMPNSDADAAAAEACAGEIICTVGSAQFCESQCNLFCPGNGGSYYDIGCATCAPSNCCLCFAE